MSESPVQKRLLQIVHDQPEDSSRDEILRELAFDRVIQRGLRDFEEARVVPTEELRRRIKSWAT